MLQKSTEVRVIHDHADGVRQDNVSASALPEHGDADGYEHPLPLPYANVDDGHHAYARARAPLSHVHENDCAALLDEAIRLLP